MANQEKAARGRRLREYGREVKEDRDAMVEAARGAVTELTDLAREQVTERPYTVLGSTFGLGLVLGGGLPLSVVGFTARAAAGMVVRQMVEGALPGGTAPRKRSRAQARRDAQS